MSGLLADLRGRVKGDVRYDEPLSRYTTYRIGGPAAALIEPTSVDDVAATLMFAADTGTPWMALGLGSNVLIADRGFDGIVLRMGKGLDRVTEADPHTWVVGAGLPTPLLARRTSAAALAGVHRLIGVPGTVGGGVVMNAGAHGQEFAHVVRSVTAVTSGGVVREIAAGAIPWRYRTWGLEGMVVVRATLQFTPGDLDELKQDIRRHLEWRKAGTPFDEPCCGSVFRNPDPAPGTDRRTAGQLIEAAGLKGFTVGGAQVSPLHANYIVNLGGATAADVRRVIEAVRERVRSASGVELQLEVRLIGEP